MSNKRAKTLQRPVLNDISQNETESAASKNGKRASKSAFFSIDMLPAHIQNNILNENGADTSTMDSEVLQKRIKDLEEINSNHFDPKMAFNYKIIEQLSTFLRNVDGHMDFKLIGESLDAATKVYSSRVDLLHKQTQKISARLVMAGGPKDKKSGDQQKKKKVKRMESGVNLVKNVSTINGKIEKNIEIDPLYQRLAAAYDVSNVSVLMQRQLPLDPYGQMILDSKHKLDIMNPELYPLPPSNYISVPFPLKKPTDLQTVHPAFENFDFHDRSFDMEEYVIQIKTKTDLEKANNKEEGRDPEEIPLHRVYGIEPGEQIEREIFSPGVLEMSHAPGTPQGQYTDLVNFDFNQQEEEFSMDDYFGGGGEHNISNESIEQNGGSGGSGEHPHSPPQAADITRDNRQEDMEKRMRFMMNIVDLDDGKRLLNRQFLRRIFRNDPRMLPRASPQDGDLEQQQQQQDTALQNKRIRRDKPRYEPLKFDDCVPPLREKHLMAEATVRKRVERCKLSRQRPAMGVKFYHFKSMFLTPQSVIIQEKASSKRAEQAEAPPHTDVFIGDNDHIQDDVFHDAHDASYDDDPHDVSNGSHGGFDLSMDSVNLSSQNRRGATGMNSSIVMTDTGIINMPRYVTDFGEEHDPFELGDQDRNVVPWLPSVDEPRPIQEQYLEYSTKMKKINIKKLKKVMFSFIEKFACKTDEFKEHLKRTGNPPEHSIQFYELMSLVATDGGLDERTLKDLTIPIFIVAMLHLCNDKRLVLRKLDEQDANFYILRLASSA